MFDVIQEMIKDKNDQEICLSFLDFTYLRNCLFMNKGEELDLYDDIKSEIVLK